MVSRDHRMGIIVWALVVLAGLSACDGEEAIMMPGPRIDGFELLTRLEVKRADEFTVTVGIVNRSGTSQEIFVNCRRDIRIYRDESGSDLVGSHPQRCEQEGFTLDFGPGEERTIEMRSFEIIFSEPIDTGNYFVSVVLNTAQWTVELPVGLVPLDSKERNEQILEF